MISDISDHLPNFLLIQLNAKHIKHRPFIRSYTKRNIEKYKSNIANEIDQFILNEQPNHNNIGHFYSQFFLLLNNLHDKYFPKVKLSRKKANDKIWITEGIKISIKHKNRLFQLQVNNPTKDNIKTWKTYRNQLNKIIKKAQTDYYKILLMHRVHLARGFGKLLVPLLAKIKQRSHKSNS